MIGNLSVGAVTINVGDVEACAAFYRDIVGLKERDRGLDHAILGTRSRDLVVLRGSPDGGVVSPATGLFHMAIRFPSRADLGRWLAGFLGRPSHERRYLEGSSDHGVSEALYLSDPEGNGVEIYADRPRDVWPRDSAGGINMYTERLDIDDLAAAAGTTTGSDIPDGTDMGHVHFKVNDIERSREFYVDVLGLDLVMYFGRFALFVSTGGYHHQIGLNTWHSAGAPSLPEGALGLVETAFDVVVEEEDEQRFKRSVAAYTKRLKERGIDVQNIEKDSVAIRDPAGIRLRLNFRRESG